MAAFAIAALAGTPAHAQEPVTVGVAAPLSGDFALLGRQWVEGARVAASRDGAVRLVEADDGCTAEGGAQAARRLAEAGAGIVVGFLCTEAVEAALPVFKEAGIPVVTAVRTTSLTDRKARTGWPVYRLAPRADAEGRAVADILVQRWRDAFFAIVDDGTIYGRELAENLRAAAEMAELEPVFIDTYRPQLDNQIGLVGRLRRAGATHVFVGGDRSDIAIMARDAADLGYAVTFAGGEALLAADGPEPLPAGVLMIAPLPWQALTAPAVLEAFEAANVHAEGYAVPGHVAVELASGALRVAREDQVPVSTVLDSAAFETAIGQVRFDEKGDFAGSLYRLFRYDGARFVEVE